MIVASASFLRIGFLLVVLATLLAAGCVETSFDDEIVFRRDGSGTVRFTFAVAREGLAMMGRADEVTQKMKQDLPPDVSVRTRADQKWAYWDLTFSFRHTADLQARLAAIFGGRGEPEGILNVSFSRSGGFLRSSYQYSADLRLTFRGDAAIMAPYFRGWTHRVVLPGRIVRTNGTRAGNGVQWSAPVGQIVRVSATSEANMLPSGMLVGVLLIGAAAGAALYARRGLRIRPPARWCDQCGAALVLGAHFCDQCGAATGESR